MTLLYNHRDPRRARPGLQGYFAHEKTSSSLGPAEGLTCRHRPQVPRRQRVGGAEASGERQAVLGQHSERPGHLGRPLRGHGDRVQVRAPRVRPFIHKSALPYTVSALLYTYPSLLTLCITQIVYLCWRWVGRVRMGRVHVDTTHPWDDPFEVMAIECRSVPPHRTPPQPLADCTPPPLPQPLFVSKRRGINLKGLQDFYLKAKARIWPWLSYMCHIRSTADLCT